MVMNVTLAHNIVLNCELKSYTALMRDFQLLMIFNGFTRCNDGIQSL